MGLTNSSTGRSAVDSELIIQRRSEDERVVALAGNPNVGKSTVFNALTGMKQHTGNWPGKTVTNAQGYCKSKNASYIMVDIPGTYSLMAHSSEEEVARDFICFGNPDAVVVVCDATCLERNLNLVLQTMEVSHSVTLCLNLIDEAKRKGITINTELLKKRLGIPVIPVCARKKKTLKSLIDAMDSSAGEKKDFYQLKYPQKLEKAITTVKDALELSDINNEDINLRWLALRLLEGDESLISQIKKNFEYDITANEIVAEAINSALSELSNDGIAREQIKDICVSTLVTKAHRVCNGAVNSKQGYNSFDRRVDKLLTGKVSGYPLMIALLCLVFWLTVVGANYPSELLSKGLFFLQEKIDVFLAGVGTADWLRSILVDGVYRVLSWVVSVMLPPMAIFFPLFTLLEDSGYLPRIAYNLDRPFKRCNACGKQALTMCMGFGCNAAGVVGARIIDSPRERLLAILTNAFVPCNGRFPAIITLISIFFAGIAGGIKASAISAVSLTLVIILGVFMTFLATKLLSKTLLRGVPSSFTLELPPYRKPQIGSVIVRSVFDRTLFVLGRAVAVAAPAGLVIWICANLNIGGVSLLSHMASFLDPFARLMGLDGVILIAFILGFPANEIVLPIAVMAYTANGTLSELGSLAEMRNILVANGWTATTAVCTILFSLMHWPCSTTVMTVKKETGSMRWTLLSIALPTVFGILCCMAVNLIMSLF